MSPLFDSADRIGPLAEHAPCGFVVTDRAGMILEANAEFVRLAAVDRAEVVHRRSLASFLSVGGRVFFETHLLPMLQHSGSVREIDVDVVRNDGSKQPVLLNATAVPSDEVADDDVVVFILLEARDRHRYEANLLEATRSAQEAHAHATQLARTLQQTLIPPALPRIAGLSLAATYRPAGDGSTVGGDFYDVFQTGAHRWFIALGDVSGKGVEAAVVTALVRHHIRAVAIVQPDPAALLHDVNAVLLDHESEHYVTIAVACLDHDSATGRWQVRLALGGHAPALVREPSGEVWELGDYGTPVGLVSEPTFATVSHVMGSEVIVLFTDGVTEARREAEFFGDARLAALLTHVTHSPASITDAVTGAVLDFQAGWASDDIAVMSLMVDPALAP